MFKKFRNDVWDISDDEIRGIKNKEVLTQEYEHINKILQDKEKFINNLKSIIKYYENNGSNLYLTLRIKEELIEWFIIHINKQDRQLGVFLNH